MRLPFQERFDETGDGGFVWLAGLPGVTARRPLLYSLVCHCLLFFLLLRAPEPTFVKPAPVVAGRNGTSVTQIYWTGERDDRTRDSSAERGRTQEESRSSRDRRLELPREALRHKPREKDKLHVAKADDSPTSVDQSGAHQAAPAGSPFGSLSYGSVFGTEVRPAYPIRGSDPAAGAGDLPPGFEGDVIVEVTIDEQGNVIARSVIQSINPIVDGKSLAALASWRFRPATRNGVPIASKHDVYFHFRAR